MSPAEQSELGAQATQTILSEAWDSGTPSSLWSFENQTTGPDYRWGVRDCYVSTPPNAIWAVGGGAAGAGLACPNGTYPHNVDSWAVYGPFSLANATAANLSFVYYVNAEPIIDSELGDRFQVLVSTNGTNFTLGDEFSGADRTGQWSQAFGPALLGQPAVWIALRFKSDRSVNAAVGAVVDAITITATVPDSTAPTATPSATGTTTAGGSPTATASPTATTPGGSTRIVLSETWDGGSSLPSGWQTTDTSTGPIGYSWGVRQNCWYFSAPNAVWASGGGANGAARDCLTGYVAETDSWLVYGPFSLADAQQATLRARYWLDTEPNFDTLKFLISTDNATFFRLTEPLSGTLQSQTFETRLPSQYLGQSRVYIGLRFQSDSSVQGFGAYLDDVQLTVEGGAATPTPTATTSGPTATPSSTPTLTATPTKAPVIATATSTAITPPTATPTLPSGSERLVNETWDTSASLPSGWRALDQSAGSLGYTWGPRQNCWFASPSNSVWVAGGGANGATRACQSGYVSNLDAWLIHDPVSLANVQSATLRVRYWLDSEANFDTLKFLASTDGTTFFQLVAPVSGQLFEQTLEVDLPAQFLGQPAVHLGFRFQSDDSVNHVGAFIDDVSLVVQRGGAATATASPVSTATGTVTVVPSATPTATQTPTLTPTTVVKGTPPLVTSVSPTNGSNRALTSIAVRGANFRAGASVSLERAGVAPAVLTDITVSDSSRIFAVVQTGLGAGTYDVVVTNSDGTTARLAAGYTVTSEAPRPETIAPLQGSNEIPNNVTIDGFNFFDGVQVELARAGASTILTQTVRDSSTRLGATIPVGIPAGAYDVVLRNPGVASAGVISSAYTVISPNSDDFFIEAGDIWTDPPTLRRGDPNVKLGVNLHRRGGQIGTVVTVKFYRIDPNNPNAPGLLIGQNTSLPILRDEDSSVYIQWPVGDLEGNVTVQAVIEPPAAIVETNTLNNRAARSLTILPAAPDQTPPDLTDVAVNDGAVQTASRQVTVTLQAQDNPGGSGLATMYLVELVFNPSAKSWIDVQRLQNITFTTPHVMTLTPGAGVRYIQAWVADAQANYSLNRQKKRIDYTPPTDTLLANQVRLYRRELRRGDTISVRLAPTTGDADVWIYGPDDNAVLVRNASGLAVDQGSYTVPTNGLTGTYQVEVFAYTSTTFDLSIDVSPTRQPAGAASLEPAVAPNAAKDDRPRPLVSAASEPAANQSLSGAPITQSSPVTNPTPLRVFLPTVLRSRPEGW